MKCKLSIFLLAALLLIFTPSVPIAAAESDFSESATSQAFYSLVSYSRMCKGLSPFYVLDQGTGKKDGYPKTGSVDRVQDLIDGIVAFKKGNATVQGWIDTEPVGNVDMGAWYVITLSQSGSYDFSAYEKALLNYLNENPNVAMPTVQKLALALIAAGSHDPLIQEIADRSIEKATVMVQIYGLHLLNNGVTSAAYTVEEVKTALLAAQRKDGGWALMGQNGDVDVTAMVLQALAPYYGEANVKAAADRAVAFLSARQNADGSFSGWGGKANCESTAQVITALSDWRIDCAVDARFIKNGKTPLDALRQFRLSDGSFSHTVPTKAEESNETPAADSPGKKEQPGKTGADNQKGGSAKTRSSEQQPSGETEETAEMPEESPSDLTEEKEETVASETDLSEEETGKTEKEKKPMGYKPILAAVLFVLFGGAALLLTVFKKATRKNLLLIGGVFALSLIFVFATNFETVRSHNQVAPKTNVIGTVTLSIRCDTVAGKGDPDFIPKDGCILPETEFEIEPGDTVYDVLEEATKRFSLHMEKKGGDGMVYVAAIAHLYELQFGEMSGWVYHVNGESPFVGCDSYTLSDGDTVEWMYTLDLGADVGNTFMEEE